MAGRPPRVGHVRNTFLTATDSAKSLFEALEGLAAIHPNAAGSRLHPEQCRRIVELAFLGVVSAWEEFLEQTFVRYLAGAVADDGHAPPLRMGKASSIGHAYQLISGDPKYDPSRSYSKFGDPSWVIGISKNYFVLGAPFATKLQPHQQILQEAVRIRNRVAHNSQKAREDFKRSARIHLELGNNAALPQGYTAGDLLMSEACTLFGQRARDRHWTYFYAYVERLTKLAKDISPPSESSATV